MTVPLPASGSTSWYSWATQVDALTRPPGTVPDYTGRYATTGTGTDNRTAIQNALNAATDGGAGGYYYQYLTRRSTTVKLAPGHYVLTAPSSGPTLKIPAGVLFDTTDATLYFDYPSSARTDWTGIEVGQYASLKVGKLYPSGRTSLPGSALVYDAVRVVQTDNNSHVTGYGDSEIRGWTGGAGIRGVGAYVTYVTGIRFVDVAYGYVASNVGTGLGYTLADPNGTGWRAHTDLRIRDCLFVNITNGCFLGAVQGNTGAINDPDYSHLSLTVGFVGCIFERSAVAPAFYSAMTLSFVDCAFEDVGTPGGPVISVDNCQAINFTSFRVNLAGATVPGPSGTAAVIPNYILGLSSSDFLTIDSAYIFNNANSAMTLVNALPRKGSRISAITPAQLGLAAGPLYPTAMLMGTVDGGNSLFTTGNVETMPRYAPLQEWAGTSGRLWLSYFTPPVTTTLTKLAVNSGSTAAATTTLARLALFLVNNDGSITKVAQTASDTTIGAGTFTEYLRSFNTTGGFPASYTVVAGQRYAIGFLQVATTPMAPRGGQPNGAFSLPLAARYVDSQTDIAASYTNAALTTWYQAVYFTGIP